MKRFLKFTLLALLLLIVLLAVSMSWLYFSADFMTPSGLSHNTDKELTIGAGYWEIDGNYLRESESGLWEMKISGGAFERGVAIGRLTEDLLYYQERVFVDQIKRMIPSEGYLKFLRFLIVIFNRNLAENVPEEFRNEIYGISLSCSNEFDFIGSAYERQLNYHSAHDIGHAMQDYMLVGCSSFAAWGSLAKDSSLIVGRNFDFYMGDDFRKNRVVSFYEPDSGYKFASVGWAGMTGVLSGMNEAGLTVTINAAKSSIPTSAATPISILTREILQYASNIEEAYEIAGRRKLFVSESILIGSARDGRAAIIEKSPAVTSLYETGDSYLISTNHFQSEAFREDKRNIENILTSDSEYRFNRLGEMLGERFPLDEYKSAEILRDYAGLGGSDIGLTNPKSINQFLAHHSVIFMPEQLIMWVSTDPWQNGKYVAYDLNKIFMGTEAGMTLEGTCPDGKIEVSDSDECGGEIYSAELNIPEDSFVNSEKHQNLVKYKRLDSYIRERLGRGESVTADTLSALRAVNGNYYLTYELLGDYCLSVGDAVNARLNWEIALTKEMPYLSDKERIATKIKKSDERR